ncbi:hypothetical protein GHT06_014998 [Daphnia sinensis]|uniref:Uncharacterized protein n=1 Tax=Daphnia sinensis TaxID=1820382 RepID=A0AAD5LAA5_9CRUS|nr:hypothetical protein GHT06_014998 [Daphnia sinensis]
MDHVEELMNNMVHFRESVNVNGTVDSAQMNFSQSPVIDTIKVLYNSSEGFVRPKEIERSSTSQWCFINGRDWDEFSRQVWRYSSPEHIVFCNINVGNDSINGVVVEDILRKNASFLVIQGTKSFSAIEVINNFTTNTPLGLLTLHFMVGEIDSTEKRERAAFHRIGADRRSRVGFVNFTGPLLIGDAEVDSLTDLLIKNLLITSGQQPVLPSIEVDVLDVPGNIDCPDINGRNLDDLLHADKGDTHIVLDRVRISDDLVINNLVMGNGSFNSVEIITLIGSTRCLLKIRNIELRAINGQNLSDFVQIAGTCDIQSITGPMDIQHVTVENYLKIEDHVLNGCNPIEYLNVTEFARFDSLSIRNGSLLLDQPSENNPDLASPTMTSTPYRSTFHVHDIHDRRNHIYEAAMKKNHHH